MKKIGMIGGFSPESTLEYYRLLIETYNKQATNKKNPEIIIYSMGFARPAGEISYLPFIHLINYSLTF